MRVLPAEDQFAGMPLRLINTTNSVREFNASDSRLTIVQEAMDKDGKWKPIEYLTSSWCGNSYRVLALGANEYWPFLIPRYDGSFPTLLRVRLSQ